jgi:hypothetical protein
MGAGWGCDRMGHGDDPKVVSEGACNDLHDLTKGQGFFVAAIVDLTRGTLRMVDGEQYGVGEILGVAEALQGQSVVGEDDRGSIVANPAYDTPLPGHQLVGAVDIGVAEVGRRRLGGKERFLRSRDAVSLGILLHPLDPGCILRRWNGKAGGVVDRRVHITAIGRHAAHRDELPDSPREDLRCCPQASVGRDTDVECATIQCASQRGGIVGVGMDVLHLGRDLLEFVTPGVEDGHPEAPPEQAPDHEMTGGPRSSDDESLHPAFVPHCGPPTQAPRFLFRSPMG